ncbi:MAG: tail fiber domain-containing protein [Chitinophagaceae bacterium]|nr:tail fiber domain-containing protein [Chitinophagaceae bacterium]
MKNAKTGINMSDPVALLDIKGLDGTINRHIRLEATSSSNSANIYYNNDLVIQNNSPGGDFYFKDDAGTNAMSLFSTGNMTIAGTLTQNSDARLKKNIQPIQNSLQKILSIGGYQYNWKENYRDKSLQTGLLAQQVEQQMPELVKEDKEGIKSVNYSGIIPYTVEAIKELKKENDELKAELKELKKIVAGLLLKDDK